MGLTVGARYASRKIRHRRRREHRTPVDGARRRTGASQAPNQLAKRPVDCAAGGNRQARGWFAIRPIEVARPARRIDKRDCAVAQRRRGVSYSLCKRRYRRVLDPLKLDPAQGQPRAWAVEQRKVKKIFANVYPGDRGAGRDDEPTDGGW
jgi:hypothetical protein